MKNLRTEFITQTFRTARRTLLTRKLLFSLPEGSYLKSDRVYDKGWTVSAAGNRERQWHDIPQEARQRGCTIYGSEAHHDTIARAIHGIPVENLQRLTKDVFLGLPAGAHIFFYMGNSSSPLLYIASPAEGRQEQWADIPPRARDAICAMYGRLADVPEHLQLMIPAALTATEFTRKCMKAYPVSSGNVEINRS